MAIMGGGTASNPYAWMENEAVNAIILLSDRYAFAGCSITIHTSDDGEYAYYVTYVTPGRGLTISNNTLSGTLAGNPGQTVTITVQKENLHTQERTSTQATFRIAENTATVIGSGTSNDPYLYIKATPNELVALLAPGDLYCVDHNTAMEITDKVGQQFNYSCTINGYGMTKTDGVTSGTVVGSGTMPVTISFIQMGGSGTIGRSLKIKPTVTVTLAGQGTWALSGMPSPVTVTELHVQPGAEWMASGNYLYFSGSTGGSVYFTPDTYYTFTNITPASGTLSTNITITANTTYNPPVQPTAYFLAFNSNGGTGSVPSTQSASEYTTSHTFTIPMSPTPTRSGYVFMGWNMTKTETVPTYQPGQNVTLSSSSPVKTLYAIWGYELTFETYPSGVGTLSQQSVIAQQGVSYYVLNNSIIIGNSPSAVSVTATNGGVFNFHRWAYQGFTLSSGPITSAMNIVAEWESDTPTPSYPTEHLPKAAVRIYKDVNSTAYFDVTFKMTSQPKVYKAVNRAGNFSFSISIDPWDSPLSPTFNRWTEGAVGPVDWGMYVVVENINEDGSTTYVTDGYIATMEVSEYVLTIQCADHLAILGSRGADIHRNYYDSRTANELRGVIVGEASDEYIDADVTDIYEYGGTIDTSTVKYRVDVEIPYNEGDTRLLLQSGRNSYSVTWTVTVDQPFKGIRFKMWQTAGTDRGMCYLNDIPYTWEHQQSASGEFYLTVDFGQIYGAGDYSIRITAEPIGSFDTSTVQVYAKLSSGTGTIYHTYTNRTYADANVNCTFYGFTDATATASVTSSDGRTYLHITSITGASITSDYEALTNPSDSRVSFAYISGTVSAPTIISNIATRSAYWLNVRTDNVRAVPEFKLFRTGGGYSLDYLQKVADAGHAMTFTASGFTKPTIRVGARRTSADGASYNVEYGRTDTAGNYLLMYDFRPRKTMQNRPSRALIRTAISSQGETTSKPVIALVYNHPLVTSRHNVSTDTVVSNSSVLSVLDAVRSAYSAVYVDEEDWEGTLTLSGIVPDLIDPSGTFAGSGKVLSVTDERYGFFYKKFVVTDVTIDYESITTQVSLSNAAQVYSSAVNDSIATAYTAADLAVGDSETTAYNTQYVYIQTDAATVQSTNSVSITTGTGTYALSNISAYVMEGHTLVYGTITFTNANKSTLKYDGRGVVLNGTGIIIPMDSRPDCYEGQTVIVNIDVIQA